MSQFSTNEAVSLDKTVDLASAKETDPRFIEETYEISRCCEWIASNNFKTVCLQFPDHLLPDSSHVAGLMQGRLGRTVYILGDTAYESCCLDFVAAQHINADCVVHFGPVCFSQSSDDIPHLKIYEKTLMCVETFREKCAAHHDNTIVLDTEFVHLKATFEVRFPHSIIVGIDQVSCGDLADKEVVFVTGTRGLRKIANIKFSYRPKTLHYYDTNHQTLTSYEDDQKVIKRRHYLSEKIKDARTLGIVIGTLAIKNYLTLIERIKHLARINHKKYYLISVGKPTVAKLANFPEIDIYVVVTCALNEIYDSRDFYRPIVTPYDVEMALNDAPNLTFSYDYNDFVTDPIREPTRGGGGDVSLLTGAIRTSFEATGSGEGTGAIGSIDLGGGETRCVIGSDSSGGGEVAGAVGGEVALKQGTVALETTHGAGYLANRTWRGLEVGGGEVEGGTIVAEGRRGIAQQYTNET